MNYAGADFVLPGCANGWQRRDVWQWFEHVTRTCGAALPRSAIRSIMVAIWRSLHATQPPQRHQPIGSRCTNSATPNVGAVGCAPIGAGLAIRCSAPTADSVNGSAIGSVKARTHGDRASRAAHPSPSPRAPDRARLIARAAGPPYAPDRVRLIARAAGPPREAEALPADHPARSCHESLTTLIVGH
jgi:hypothetical protein